MRAQTRERSCHPPLCLVNHVASSGTSPFFRDGERAGKDGACSPDAETACRATSPARWPVGPFACNRMICELLLILDDLFTELRRRLGRILRRAQRLEFAKQPAVEVLQAEILRAESGAFFAGRHGCKVRATGLYRTTRIRTIRCSL